LGKKGSSDTDRKDWEIMKLHCTIRKKRGRTKNDLLCFSLLAKSGGQQAFRACSDLGEEVGDKV